MIYDYLIRRSRQAPPVVVESLLISVQSSGGLNYAGTYEAGSVINNHPSYTMGNYVLSWDNIPAGEDEWGYSWPAFTGYVLHSGNDAVAGFSTLEDGSQAVAVGQYGEMYMMDWEVMQSNFVSLPTTFNDNYTVVKGSEPVEWYEGDPVECEGVYSKTNSICNGLPVYRKTGTNFFVYCAVADGVGKALCWTCGEIWGGTVSTRETISVWGGEFYWTKHETTSTSSLNPAGSYVEYGMRADYKSISIS